MREEDGERHLDAATLWWFGIEAPWRHEEFMARLVRLAAGIRDLPPPDFQSEPSDFVRVLEANGEDGD